MRQRPREAVFESLECGQRGLFTGAASCNDLGTFELNTHGAIVIRFQAGSRNPCFNATVFPAIADRTGKLVGAHPRQGVVPPFPGNSVRTPVPPAIESNSPPPPVPNITPHNTIL